MDRKRQLHRKFADYYSRSFARIIKLGIIDACFAAFIFHLQLHAQLQRNTEVIRTVHLLSLLCITELIVQLVATIYRIGN